MTRILLAAKRIIW